MALSESLFSRDLKEAYKVFIDLCFAPYQGHGKDEGFRTDISKYKDIHTIVAPEKPNFQRKTVKKIGVFIQQSVENSF
jgi:hypothetical protein